MEEEYTGRGIFASRLTTRAKAGIPKPETKAQPRNKVPEGYISYTTIAGNTFGGLELRRDIERALKEAVENGAPQHTDGSYDISVDGVTFPAFFLSEKRKVPYIKEETKQQVLELIAARNDAHRADLRVQYPGRDFGGKTGGAGR